MKHKPTHNTNKTTSTTNKSHDKEADQSNKRHRAKSKKLEKREKRRKNSKSNRKERHYIHRIEKFIIKKFKFQSRYLHFESLPFDLLEIEKYLKKLLNLIADSKQSYTEIVDLFTSMDQGAEIDLSELENKELQRYLLKLMKKLRIYSIGMKNPFIFKILKSNNSNKVTKLINKVQFTTDSAEIIHDSLQSYASFVESFFEFLIEEKEREDLNKEHNVDVNDVDDKSDDGTLSKGELSEEEYDDIINNVGRNAELINKTFDRIMRNDDIKNHELKMNNKIEEDDDDEYENDYENEDSNDFGPTGPTGSDFVKSSLNLINTSDDFESLINYNKPSNRNNSKNNNSNKTYSASLPPTNNINAVNAESYNRILQENQLENNRKEIEYEKEHRSTSLLQEYQQNSKTSNKKHSNNNTKKSVLQTIESKNVLSIIQQNSGLDRRFKKA